MTVFIYSPLAVTIVGPAADLCHPLSARWRASASAPRQREMATASRRLSRSWMRQRGKRCDIPSWTCLAAAPGRCAPLRRPGGCVPATGGALSGREGTSTVTALTRSGRAVRVQSADGGYPRRGESAGQPRSHRSDSERAGCGPPQGVGGPRPPAARQGPLTCCPRARGSLLPRVHGSWKQFSVMHESGALFQSSNAFQHEPEDMPRCCCQPGAAGCRGRTDFEANAHDLCAVLHMQSPTLRSALPLVLMRAAGAPGRPGPGPRRPGWSF